MNDAGIIIAVVVILLVGGVVFTLAWWKIADRWADAEHKRFKTRDQAPIEKIVVRTTPAGDAPPPPAAPGASVPGPQEARG